MDMGVTHDASGKPMAVLIDARYGLELNITHIGETDHCRMNVSFDIARNDRHLSRFQIRKRVRTWGVYFVRDCLHRHALRAAGHGVCSSDTASASSHAG